MCAAFSIRGYVYCIGIRRRRGVCPCSHSRSSLSSPTHRRLSIETLEIDLTLYSADQPARGPWPRRRPRFHGPTECLCRHCRLRCHRRRCVQMKPFNAPLSATIFVSYDIERPCSGGGGRRPLCLRNQPGRADADSIAADGNSLERAHSEGRGRQNGAASRGRGVGGMVRAGRGEGKGGQVTGVGARGG